MTWQDQALPGGPRDLIGYGPNPPRVKWPDEARVVVSLVLNYEEGAEFAAVAGDDRNEGFHEYSLEPIAPPQRDLVSESVYEYGSRAGVWRLARLFDHYDLKVTVFACAVALVRQPAVAAWIARAGHEACSHGWRWYEAWKLTRDEEREEIAKAVADIERMTGQRPFGWNARYGPSAHTRELLVEEGGFLYDSDAYNDDLPYFVNVLGKRHLVIPYTKTYNDVRFVSAQGYSRPGDFTEWCRTGLDYLWEEGATHPKMMSIGIHARLMGQPARAAALRDFIQYALHKPGVKFMRRVDIARWWIEHHNEFES
jgi:peptidoglycan/xylan/chitin deacetylase (PgdA/CDA1 family)